MADRNIISVKNCSTYGMEVITLAKEGKEKIVITFSDKSQHPFIIMGKQIDQIISFLQESKNTSEK